MASGMGMRGTVGRCFYFFQDLQKCALALQEKRLSLDLSEEELSEERKKCGVYRADYMECLHGGERSEQIKALKKAIKEGGDGGHGH